jgi:type II secretory pathway pseudopilin PulG
MWRVSVVLIVVLAVLGVLLLVALVGAAGASKRNRAGAQRFTESLSAVDRQLATAIAQDRGWHPDTLDAAARSEFAAQRPGVEIADMQLVQITDEPGTDDDVAVFRVAAAGGASRLTLGRRDGAWYAVAVEDDR